MENSEHKYLLDGTEVVVEKEIDGGFLIRKVYEYEDENEDYYGETVFVKSVFDSAPTEKLDASIKALTEVKSELEKQNGILREEKRNIEAFIQRNKFSPEVQMLFKYLTRDFKWVLCHTDLDVTHSDKIFTDTTTIKAQITSGKLMLHRPSSYNDSPVWVFDTKEEAEAKRKEEIIKRIQSCYHTHNLNSIVEKYDWQDVLSTDEAKEAIEIKRTELTGKDRSSRIENATKEYEKYKKQLEELGVTPT